MTSEIRYIIFFLLLGGLTTLSCDRLDPVDPHHEDYFLKYYGNEGDQEGISVIACSDGYILAGINHSVGVNSEIYLVRTDEEGAILWEKTFGVMSHDLITIGMVLGESGNLYIAANYTETTSIYDFYLLKVDPNGVLLASSRYGFPGENDELRSISINNNEEIILTGSTSKVENPSQTLNTDDIYTLRLSSDLVVFEEENWNTIQGFEGRDIGRKIIPAGDDSYFFLGETEKNDDEGLTNETNLIFYSLTDDGRFPKGDRIIGTLSNDYAGDITPTSVNGCVIAENSVNANGNTQIYLIRANAEGEIVVNEPLQGVGNARALSILEANYGGYFILGERILDTDTDLLLIKVDENFQLDWQQAYGGLSNDSGVQLAELADGRIIMTGTVTLESQSKMFLMKTQSDGTLVP